MSFLSLKDSRSVLDTFCQRCTDSYPCIHTPFSHAQVHILASTCIPAFKMVNQSVTTSKHRNEGTGKVTDYFAAGYSTVLQLWRLAFLLFMAFLTYRFIISSFTHMTFMRPLFSRAVSPCFITITHHKENINPFSLWIKLSLRK